MTSNDVARWRNSREWLNGGECCGDKDSDGICAAPACIFGEAVKELQLAADYIEKLEAANLKQSCIKVDDQMRIEKLEAALDDAMQYVSRADWYYLKDETRKALEREENE